MPRQTTISQDFVFLTRFFTRAETQGRGERKKLLFSTEKRPKKLCAFASLREIILVVALPRWVLRGLKHPLEIRNSLWAMSLVPTQFTVEYPQPGAF